MGIDTSVLAQLGGQGARKYLPDSIGPYTFVEVVDRHQYRRIPSVVGAYEGAEISMNYQMVLAGMAYAWAPREAA